MKYIFAFSILISTTAIADDLSADQIKKIEIAINSNDINSVSTVLSGQKEPFAVPSGMFKDIKWDNSPGKAAPNFTGEAILKKAINHDPCRDEIALKLIENGANYYSDSTNTNAGQLLNEASENGCGKVVEYFTAKGDQNQVSTAAITFFQGIEKDMSSIFALRKQGLQMESKKFDAKESVQVAYEKFVMSGCPDKSKSTKVCEAREKLESMMAEMQKQGEEIKKSEADQKSKEEYARTPEGMVQIACKLKSEIQSANAEIERQKKIAKVSGTQNNLILHKNGAKVVDLETMLDVVKKEYRLKVKKEMPKTCPE